MIKSDKETQYLGQLGMAISLSNWIKLLAFGPLAGLYAILWQHPETQNGFFKKKGSNIPKVSAWSSFLLPFAWEQLSCLDVCWNFRPFVLPLFPGFLWSLQALLRMNPWLLLAQAYRPSKVTALLKSPGEGSAVIVKNRSKIATWSYLMNVGKFGLRDSWGFWQVRGGTQLGGSRITSL